ncbi:DM13 domain-containing protein [Nitrosopumilus sp.]|uniref:DM13 domain-containing protein n=1 Tax=Nitrosopumilus sp. TaxID=2024843 RepID=UPI003D118701
MNKYLIPIIAIAIVGPVSIFAISPYFTESSIDEALPTGAVVQPMMEETMMEETMMEETMMEETMMEETMMEETMMEETMMEETMMEETMMEETMMEETMMEKMVPVSYSGTFIGVGDGIHDAQGDAYTIPLEDGSNILRLENFKSTNGPDLYVYLATDDNASEFLNLGELKANKGNQNYEIPDDADLTKYNKVLIWCQAFSVLFGSAELS